MEVLCEISAFFSGKLFFFRIWCFQIREIDRKRLNELFFRSCFNGNTYVNALHNALTLTNLLFGNNAAKDLLLGNNGGHCFT